MLLRIATLNSSAINIFYWPLNSNIFQNIFKANCAPWKLTQQSANKEKPLGLALLVQIKYYQNWKTKGVDTDVIIDGVISHPKPHKNSENVHPQNIEAGREEKGQTLFFQNHALMPASTSAWQATCEVSF